VYAKCFGSKELCCRDQHRRSGSSILLLAIRRKATLSRSHSTCGNCKVSSGYGQTLWNAMKSRSVLQLEGRHVIFIHVCVSCSVGASVGQFWCATSGFYRQSTTHSTYRLIDLASSALLSHPTIGAVPRSWTFFNHTVRDHKLHYLVHVCNLNYVALGHH
jgi:hypothetical protein